MEERFVDDDGKGTLRVRKDKNGMTVIDTESADGVETEETENAAEEESVFAFPEFKDDDGEAEFLTSEQYAARLQALKEQEEKLRLQTEQLLEEGDALLLAGKTEEAKEAFLQADEYADKVQLDGRVHWGLALAITEEFTHLDGETVAKCDLENAEKHLSVEQRKAALEKYEERLTQAEAELSARAEATKTAYKAVQAKRQAVIDKEYARTKKPMPIFIISILALVAVAAIAGGFLFKTTSSVPAVLLGVTGGILLLDLIAFAFAGHKLVRAKAKMRANRNPQACKEGRETLAAENALAFVQEALRIMRSETVFGQAEEEAENAEDTENEEKEENEENEDEE